MTYTQLAIAILLAVTLPFLGGWVVDEVRRAHARRTRKDHE